MNEEEKIQTAKQMSSQERDEIMSAAARVNNSLDEPMDQTLDFLYTEPKIKK